jgi:hypothetical protein
MSDDERSGSGAPIHRHRERAPAADEISGGDPDLIEAVSDHVERHLGLADEVFDELVSPAVHVDLLRSPPTDERPYHVVVTCGMSERPMRPPDDYPELTSAELFALLPPEWPLDQQSLRDERNWWPLRVLKTLARLPHEYDTWLWSGHTVPNGDPPEPYADGTELCGALVMPPMGVPEEFDVLERPGHEPIHFLMVMPLTADELRLKLDEGVDALYDRFAEADVDPVIDAGRPSALSRRRRRFGLF